MPRGMTRVLHVIQGVGFAHKHEVKRYFGKDRFKPRHPNDEMNRVEGLEPLPMLQCSNVAGRLEFSLNISSLSALDT